MSFDSHFEPTGNVHIGDTITFFISAEDFNAGQDIAGCQVIFVSDNLDYGGEFIDLFATDASGSMTGQFVVPDVTGFFGSNFGIFVNHNVDPDDPHGNDADFTMLGLVVIDSNPAPPSQSKGMFMLLG
jgi:hypothetical protein